MKRRVFISRNPIDCEAIRAFLPIEFEVIAQSLIETKGISYETPIPLTDWIFFSSSNAARHFFEKHPQLDQQKIAAIGEATAQAIRKHHAVDFIGNASDITDSAYRFAESIGTQTVLFPIAADSLKHIQSALPAEQVIDLPVYTTTEKSQHVAPCDVYVFSSPSNVRSFFRSSNSAFRMDASCIAFGEATRDELNKQGIQDVLIPHSLEPHSIAHTIIQAVQG